MKGKEIPHSLESESSLLGSMVMDNTIIPKVLAQVTADDFYVDAYKLVFNGIAKTFTEKKAVDLVLIKDVMPADQLRAAGGPEKLMQIVNDLPNAANWEAYLATVKEKSEARGYLLSCEGIIRDLYGGVGVGDVKRRLREVAFSGGKLTERASDLGASSRQSLDTIKRFRAGGVDLGTGWRDIDDLLGGLRRKELTVFGAKMSNLKTTVALNILVNNIANGKRVLINAFENVDQVSTRIAAMFTGTPLGWFAKPHLCTDDQYAKVEEAMACLQELKDLVMVMSSSSILEMRGVCDVFKPDLIILDYLQTYGQKFCASEDGLYARAIGKVARQCQELAQDYNAHSLLLSQLARRMQGERNRPPEINDLKESGDIENCADNALLGWWPWRDQPESGKIPGDYYIYIAKNKIGPVDRRILNVNVETLSIKGYGA